MVVRSALHAGVCSVTVVVLSCRLHEAAAQTEAPPCCRQASKGRPTMVRLLLTAGADVNAQDKFGALPTACKSGSSPASTKSLPDAAYASHTHPTGSHRRPRRTPIAATPCSITEQFNTQDLTDTGSTPLHRACSAGRVDAARALVEEGAAKLEVRDRQGQTPLFVAASCGHQSVALYLIARGADITVRVERSLLLTRVSCVGGIIIAAVRHLILKLAHARACSLDAILHCG